MSLGAPEPQRHGAVEQGFKKQCEEGGGAAAESGAGIELGCLDVGYCANGGEEVVDKVQGGRCGGRGGGDDGCGGADKAGCVGHCTDDDLIWVCPAFGCGFQGGLGEAQDRFNLRDRHACEDADEELAGHSFLDSGDTEARLQISRLAAKENSVRGLNGADILALKDRDGDWMGELCELFLQPLHGLCGTHAGDVVGGFTQLFAFGR